MNLPSAAPSSSPPSRPALLLAFAAFIWLLQHVSPTVVATHAFVNPVVAIVAGWAWAGEPLGGDLALSAATFPMNGKSGVLTPPTSCRWHQAVSRDDGKIFEKRRIMEWSRA